MLKSIFIKHSIHNIPNELSEFEELFKNNDINIQWIDWKSKGDKYDLIDCCPYCAVDLDKKTHESKKEVFNKSFNKTENDNLKQMLDLINELENFIFEKEYNLILNYIKNDTSEDIVYAKMLTLVNELEIILTRLEKIEHFGERRIIIADINIMDKEINEMYIPINEFNIFGGEFFNEIIENVNKCIDDIKTEVNILKKELGHLKGLMKATVMASQNDINEFLKTAGINYEIQIDAKDEHDTKVILKQCFDKDKTSVENIKSHLSWGEKNSFALILFMYYAVSQNAELIILDDPISSFDNNKKFAILHRMFKNLSKNDVSFENKTVLLLTHDFTPITDFIIVDKINEDKICASYIWNEYGNLQEKKIERDNDIKLILKLAEEIAKDNTINIFTRVAFLRKLCELNSNLNEWGVAYQILSSVSHGRTPSRKRAEGIYSVMDEDEISIGLQLIKEYIQEFDVDILLNEVFTISNIKDTYSNELNNYYKVQIFRQYANIAKKEIKIKDSLYDDAWFKFVDETFHIENDLLHYLDIRKFNIVPSYIIEKIDEKMK